MSFVTLPDAGREVQLTVRHETYSPDYGEAFEYKYHKSHGFNRSTTVVLTDRANTRFGNGYVKARSVCKEDLGDNFSKQQGRYLAVMNLLRKLRQGQSYTKADRRAIFMAVCPEYLQ